MVGVLDGWYERISLQCEDKINDVKRDDDDVVVLMVVVVYLLEIKIGNDKRRNKNVTVQKY